MSEPLQSFLDQGTVFEGKIAFSGAVRIDGYFKGEAAAEGSLIVGESGIVEADLELRSLTVHGLFRGSVRAKERVEVSATGFAAGEATTDEGYTGHGIGLIPSQRCLASALPSCIHSTRWLSAKVIIRSSSCG